MFEAPKILVAKSRRPRAGWEREFLPAALEITETPTSPIAQAIGGTIIVAALVSFAWACIGKTDIIATAAGRLIPAGKTKVVQSLEEGEVAAIHVVDGDHVTAGAPLLELDSAEALADRDRSARDLLQARLTQSRLLGLIEATPDHPAILQELPSNASPGDLHLAQIQLEAQETHQQAQLSNLDSQIASKQAQAEEATASIAKINATLPMLQAEEGLREKLMNMEFGNKFLWYQSKEQVAEQSFQIPVLAQTRDQAIADGDALRAQQAAAISQFRLDTLDELTKTRERINDLSADLAKAEERLRLEVLRAPIAGTVQQLAVHTVGGVVTPAEPLMVIVPDHPGLLVEAVVSNQDIGFVHAGQMARIKIETFNFTRYGVVDGAVLQVSHDVVDPNDPGSGTKPPNHQDAGNSAAVDHRQDAGYIAQISLSRDWMMTETGKVPLEPGMAVTVEVSTGKRRIIQYLLSPLIRRVNEGLRER